MSRLFNNDEITKNEFFFLFLFRIKLNILILVASISLTSCEIEVVQHWNLLPFDLPYDYPVNGGYVPENNVFTGLEIGWNRIFLAIPRLRVGVPATLTWIPRRRGGELTSPALQVQCYFPVFCKKIFLLRSDSLLDQGIEL